MQKSSQRTYNFNVGLLGHVDSGKTTLAKALSSISSTAAFDKHPQSRERGITLDLGFSALQLAAPTSLRTYLPNVENLQLTFVDCPGHASLIKTIIGGAQITDLVLLIIDVQKGIQTQTGECIVISELLGCQLIVVVNKIDLLPAQTLDKELRQLHEKLRKTFSRTKFGADVPIFDIAAQYGTNTKQLLEGICANVKPIKRNINSQFLMYVDHCFSIKGQGTICTGTVLQGQLNVNDTIEIPMLKEQRKVKSIQMFHQPVNTACMGDRIGVCLTQFNAKLLERGTICKPGLLQPIYAACIQVNSIRYYKFAIKSKSKMHITVGHDTVMASIIFFCPTSDCQNPPGNTFSPQDAYEYLEEFENSKKSGLVYALLEFESPVLAAENAILIGAKLDLDAHANNCRLAFWGHMLWQSNTANYASEQLIHFNVYKSKCKEGSIQRYINNQQVIVQNLFKKSANREVYVGKRIELSTGETGVIESTFGQTNKININFPTALKPETEAILTAGRLADVKVYLRFKKNIFNKSKELVQ